MVIFITLVSKCGQELNSHGSSLQVPLSGYPAWKTVEEWAGRRTGDAWSCILAAFKEGIHYLSGVDPVLKRKQLDLPIWNKGAYKSNMCKIMQDDRSNWSIGDHVARFGIPYNRHCPSCGTFIYIFPIVWF